VPPLSDTDITTWAADYLTADGNSPSDTEYINQLLGAQARNIKSVKRAESLNKQWVRTGYVPTYISANSFSHPGDVRTVLAVGRRVRATDGAGQQYGTILTSSFAASITTVTVQWDLELSSGESLVVTGADTMEVDDDYISRYPVGSRVVIWDWDTGTRIVRVVASVVDTGANAEVTLTSGDPYLPISGLGDKEVYRPSVGIVASVSEVEVGMFTPNVFRSGLPHAFLAGTFEIELDGSDGPFAVDLPVRMDDDTYKVFITPQGVVSGSPTDTAWKKPYHSGASETAFQVSFPTGSTADDAVVAYDYVIWRP
jgi:hypothetical protein